LTPRQIASQQRTQVPHSATADSRKDALYSYGKAHSACGPHQRVHSACERSPRVRLSVRDRAQNALFRRVRFSSPAQTWGRLTEKRTLDRHLMEKRTLGSHSHGKPHSAPATPLRRDRKAHSGRATSRKSALCVWASPKTALCMRAVVAPRGHFRRSAYTAASPRLPATAQQCTQVPQDGAERLFSPICVHSCILTAARATGWGHGSHDIDGPMAPVMPGRSDLRPTPPGR